MVFMLSYSVPDIHAFIKRLSSYTPAADSCILSVLFMHFIGGTEIGMGRPLLAAKISPGGPILAGGPKFSLQPGKIL